MFFGEFVEMDRERDLLRLTLHRYTREIDWHRHFESAPLDRTLEAWNIASMAQLANLSDEDRRAIACQALDERRRASSGRSVG